MKKISILLAMLALMMFSALPAAFADDNTNYQSIEDSQNVYIETVGNDNTYNIDQNISQSGFSGGYYDDCDFVWVYYPYWGWYLVCF